MVVIKIEVNHWGNNSISQPTWWSLHKNFAHKLRCASWVANTLHILLHINAGRVTYSWRNGIFLVEALLCEFPNSAPCVSSFGWFWLLSFCYNKTVSISIVLSWVLWSVLENIESEEICGDTQICSRVV